MSKQIYITAHPYHPFFFSAGEDGNLILWDNERNNIFKNFKIDKNVSAIKLSPKGNFLVVGLEGGGVMLAEIKIEKSLYAKEYSINNLEFKPLNEGEYDKTAVLSIEFSENEKILAISFGIV